MRSAVKLIIFPLLIMALCSFAFSCITIKAPKGSTSGGNNNNSSSQSSSTTTRPHTPVRTGEITLGPSVDLASQSIASSGGGISISKPGDPLDGLSIGVPDNAYPNNTTFKVSYAPVKGHTFGSDFVPASPLITVENGGAFSKALMYVKVPVNIPTGYFAMGFIYDQKTKHLEGMPLITQDSSSMTVATRHFSSFLIGMVDLKLLKDDIDSGFRPGIDDWEFVNNGSVIAASGHCEGQSLAAMWYYCTQPDGKDLCLYGRYDNNGKQPATPDLWQDNSYGYRLCSVLQNDPLLSTPAYNTWREIAGRSYQFINNKWQHINVPALIGDSTTRNLFAFSIQMTHEPQLIKVQTDDGSGGHTMICYRVLKNTLYIADPNYPKNTERRVELVNNKFENYESGATKADIDAGNSISYNHIMYFAKSTVLDLNITADHWTEFKNGTIGNDKFPVYPINVVDDGGQVIDLKDGHITKNSKLRADAGGDFKSKICRDGEFLKRDADLKIDLVPGNNELGFYVFKKVGNNEQYVDFKYFNVKSDVDVECKTPPPANIMAILQKTTRFSCNLLNLPTDIVGSGSMNKWVPGFKFPKHFYVPGNAINLGGDGSMPITWNGTNFSGGGSIKGYPDKLTGSVCYIDGKVMVSFDYATNDIKDNLKLSIKNMPCDPSRLTRKASEGPPELIFMTTDAPTVKKYVTRLEWTSHEERPERNAPPEVWDAYLKSADWTKQCGFDIFFHF
jgi:hypothetical protein